jgi:hypothetical protein
MTPSERATELRAIITNAVFRDVMDELERDAFNRFMALPMQERMDREGEVIIAQIDAIRNVRSRLNSLASTQQVEPFDVV